MTCTDHCNHGPGAYARKIGKSDLYFYRDHAGFWNYCLRHSDEPSDYSSGMIRYWFRGSTSELIPREKVIQLYNERSMLVEAFLRFIGFDTENI